MSKIGSQAHVSHTMRQTNDMSTYSDGLFKEMLWG